MSGFILSHGQSLNDLSGFEWEGLLSVSSIDQAIEIELNRTIRYTIATSTAPKKDADGSKSAPLRDVANAHIFRDLRRPCIESHPAQITQMEPLPGTTFTLSTRDNTRLSRGSARGGSSSYPAGSVAVADDRPFRSTVYVEADLEMRKSDPIGDQNVPDRVLLRQRESTLDGTMVGC